MDRLFGTGLSQQGRLLMLASAQESGLPESLMAERWHGREGVNELFCFDVDALSTSTDLDLEQFLGQELTVRLLQPDGSRRAWHGLCTQAAWLGADGGVARYGLRLEPALSLLQLRRDNWIFHDQSVRDIVQELLADYPQVRLKFDVSQHLAPRAICTQYRESDYEFLCRILASEGLSWRFEHDQSDEETPDGQSRHSVVIFDSRAQHPVDGALRFHGVRATERDDSIDQFAARRSVSANAVSIASWDPAQVSAPAAEQSTSLDAGELPQMAVYDGSEERSYTGSGSADGHSLLMLQALELENKLFVGEGAVRKLAAGHDFTLTAHERFEGNDFTTLWIEHEARNNFTPALKPTAGVEPGTYRNRFACVRAAVPLVPAATAQRVRGATLGPQTALVVGLPGAVSTTRRDHQIRVRFPWQRDAMPDDRCGTWVRVAEALSGPNWGTQFTPRIGTEVLIDFIEGDIDRPVVVAQLYTGSDVPPFSAGVDSSANHAGMISGIHSTSFDGGGYNQWVLDDTPGQLRMRLASSTAASQLNMGHVVQQSASSAARGSHRGIGFELRSDAWTVLRSGEGLLLTTSVRRAQGAGIQSTQLEAADAVERLKTGKALADGLSKTAAEQKALYSKEALDAHEKLIAQVDPQQDGKYSGALNGQSALRAKDGSRDPDPGKPVERFASAIVALDSVDSINLATPASTLLYAGGQLHWTSASDLHMAAQHTYSAVSANAASFFAREGGIKAIAGNGAVSLQAHSGELEILADKEVTVVSVNDSIEIKASKKIVLHAGKSSVILEGGNITFACPGNFTVKSGQHAFLGGASNPAELAVLPGTLTRLDNFIALDYRDADGDPMAGVKYKIKFEGGKTIAGTLDDKGFARHENVPEKPLVAEYEERQPEPEKPWTPLSEMLSRANRKFSA